MTALEGLQKVARRQSADFGNIASQKSQNTHKEGREASCCYRKKIQSIKYFLLTLTLMLNTRVEEKRARLGRTLERRLLCPDRYKL